MNLLLFIYCISLTIVLTTYLREIADSYGSTNQIFEVIVVSLLPGLNTILALLVIFLTSLDIRNQYLEQRKRENISGSI